MTARSEEIAIRALLDDLQSEDTYSRNNAIKRIVIKEVSDQRIVDALQKLIINDPSLSVRNFARNALDALGIEHSPMEDDRIDYTKVKSSAQASVRDKNVTSRHGIMIAIIVIILLCILFGVACFYSI